MSDCKLIDAPMDSKVKLLLGQVEPLLDPSWETQLPHYHWPRYLFC